MNPNSYEVPSHDVKMNVPLTEVDGESDKIGKYIKIFLGEHECYAQVLEYEDLDEYLCSPDTEGVKLVRFTRIQEGAPVVAGKEIDPTGYRIEWTSRNEAISDGEWRIENMPT